MKEDTSDNEQEALAPKAGKVRSLVEFIGAHPFATGVLAILGVFGFVLSLVGFGLDRTEAGDTTEQITIAQTGIDSISEDVKDVREAVSADCSGPPCWTLREFARWERIGTAKDLVDRKLPAPERKRNGQFLYDLEGCRIRIEYTEDAITYFAVRLWKSVEIPTGSGKYVEQPCDVDLSKIVRPGYGFDWPTQDQIRVSDVMTALTPLPSTGYSPRLYIASACLDCGNYTEPYIEFMQRGPHASDFVNTHFMTSFDPLVDDEMGQRGYEIYSAFRERMRAKIGDEAEYGVETQPLCGQDLALDIKQELSESRLDEIGLSRGPRTWTNVLFCE